MRRNRLRMVVGILTVVSSVGFGTVWSYVRTGHAELGRRIRDAVPIAFDLKRLEQMTEDMIPELRANQKVAAQLDVELEYFKRQIAEMERSQADSKSQMQRLRASLADKQASHVFAGRTFTRQEIEADLERRLQQYDNTAGQLEAKKRIEEDRKRTLAAATDKVRQYQQQRELLVERAESLRAELQLAELSQEAGNSEFSQSKLAQTKELAEAVEKRIRTLQKLAEAQRPAAGEIPVEADGRPIADRFDAYFNKGQK